MVKPVEDGRTLEVVLGERLRLSRRGARRLLDARCVFVNDRRVWMARHRLEAGDRIEVQVSAVAPPGHGPAPESVPLQVLFEDGRVLVADKPSGILSNGEGSVESAMQARRRDPSIRAVHRLDRDTTGCLLLARSDAVFDEAVEWFRAGRVRKVYEAIAVGRVGRDLREVSSPIDGQSAVTRVTVLDATDEASHLRLVIETGRTHQIRRHLEERGHPIAGDKAYGTSRRAGERMRMIPRQMLHAAELAFPGADGTAVVVRSPLPPDFRGALKRLGLR